MAEPIPTSDALDREIEALVHRCRPYLDPTGAIARIRRLQHVASTAGEPKANPGPTEGEPVVFELDRYRRIANGTDPEAA